MTTVEATPIQVKINPLFCYGVKPNVFGGIHFTRENYLLYVNGCGISLYHHGEKKQELVPKKFALVYSHSSSVFEKECKQSQTYLCSFQYHYQVLYFLQNAIFILILETSINNIVIQSQYS